MLDPAAIADEQHYAGQGHRAPLHPPHEDQPRGTRRDRRQVGRPRPVRRRSAARPPRPRSGLRRADRRVAGRPADRRRRSPAAPPVPVHPAEGVPVLATGAGARPATQPAARSADRRAERAALDRLARARRPRCTDDDSAKLAALVDELQGDRRRPGQRHPGGGLLRARADPEVAAPRCCPGMLGLTKPGAGRRHARRRCPTEQQKIVEEFALADAPVRVLLTGDVASEGVNLHRQCHHLIHYDIPWRLIRIEQRNGRIDRYGQEHQPAVRRADPHLRRSTARRTTPRSPRSCSTARRPRTAASAPPRASPASSPPEGRRTAWSRTCSPARRWTSPSRRPTARSTSTSSPTCSAGVGDQPGGAAPQRADVPQLFDSHRGVRPRRPATPPRPTLHVDDDGEMLAFRAAGRPGAAALRPAADLPAGAQDVAERMKVTFDRTLAQRKLDEARQTKTLWPEIAYLSPTCTR